MKKIAAYTDNLNGPFGAALEAFVKENPGDVTHRAARFFHPGQKEVFDLAVVDGAAKNAEAIGEALTKWGAEVSVLETAEGDGKPVPLDGMKAGELRAYAEEKGIEVPGNLKSQKDILAFIKEYEATEAAKGDGPATS